MDVSYISTLLLIFNYLNKLYYHMDFPTSCVSSNSCSKRSIKKNRMNNFTLNSDKPRTHIYTGANIRSYAKLRIKLADPIESVRTRSSVTDCENTRRTKVFLSSCRTRVCARAPHFSPTFSPL